MDVIHFHPDPSPCKRKKKEKQKVTKVINTNKQKYSLAIEKLPTDR